MNRISPTLWLLSFCLLLVGCSDANNQQAGDGGHSHGHAATAELPLDVLVVQITEKCDAIKTAFDEGKTEEAHDPLHEIGHLLGQLPSAASKAELSPSDQTEVKDASDKLMVSFGKVDAMFHGDENGVGFDEVEEDVQNAMAVLKEKVIPQEK